VPGGRTGGIFVALLVPAVKVGLADISTPPIFKFAVYVPSTSPVKVCVAFVAVPIFIVLFKLAG
jgi:hypothetical protein